MKRAKTLSKINTYEEGNIYYEIENVMTNITWGNLNFKINNRIYTEILVEFLASSNEWYILGASETNPIKGGLGEFILNKYSLNPRFSSAIAGIMYNEGWIFFKGMKPIYIMKNNIDTADVEKVCNSNFRLFNSLDSREITFFNTKNIGSKKINLMKVKNYNIGFKHTKKDIVKMLEDNIDVEVIKRITKLDISEIEEIELSL